MPRDNVRIQDGAMPNIEPVVRHPARALANKRQEPRKKILAKARASKRKKRTMADPKDIPVLSNARAVEALEPPRATTLVQSDTTPVMAPPELTVSGPPAAAAQKKTNDAQKVTLKASDVEPTHLSKPGGPEHPHDPLAGDVDTLIRGYRMNRGKMLPADTSKHTSVPDDYARMHAELAKQADDEVANAGVDDSAQLQHWNSRKFAYANPDRPGWGQWVIDDTMPFAGNIKFTTANPIRSELNILFA